MANFIDCFHRVSQILYHVLKHLGGIILEFGLNKIFDDINTRDISILSAVSGFSKMIFNISSPKILFDALESSRLKTLAVNMAK